MCTFNIGLYAVYLIFCCILQTSCQTITLTLCSNPVKNGPCSITCNTPDTNQNIVFLRGTVTKGTCVYTGGAPLCGTGMSQTGNVTTFTISSLSKTADEGDWTCKYGTQSSTAETLTVYTEPTLTTFLNGSSTTPVSGTAFKIVNLSARSYCFFPSVSSANLQYSVGISGLVNALTTVPVVGIPATSLGCDAHEFDLQTNATVDIESSTYKDLSGKSDVYFQITFTSSLGTQYSTDFKFGPYDFEGPTTTPFMESSTTVMNTEQFSTTTERSGLSEELRNIVIIVSSVGGTVLIVVVVIVIVLCCKKRLNGKKTGEKHLKKQEFKPDVNYNLHNATNMQSKQAPVQYNHKKNEKANNEMYNLNPHGYVYPNDPGYDYIYTNDRGYGGRKVPYSDGRHNLHYDPYRRNNYPREMPHLVPYSGYGSPVQYNSRYGSPVQYNSRYGSPVQYNNMLKHEGRQYRGQQAHRGHADRSDPFDQSGYTRRQYDNNWDTLF